MCYVSYVINIIIFYSNFKNDYKLTKQTPPPRKPSGRMLASSEGGPRFNTQSRTASYQRRYTNGTSSFLVWHSTLKREKLALSQELRQNQQKTTHPPYNTIDLI